MAPHQPSNSRGGRSFLSLALLFLLATTAPKSASAYKVLFYPLGERTHLLVHLSLAAELTSRGHEVHMLVPGCHQAFAEGVLARTRPDAPPPRFIPYALDCEFVERDKQRVALAGPIQGVWLILQALAKRTDEMLSDAPLIARLRALAAGGDGVDGETNNSNKKPNGIDLLIADPLAYGGLLAYQLDLPHVDFDVGTAGVLFEPFFYGAQTAPAYVPALGTFLPTDGMSVAQKATNLIATFAARQLLATVYRSPRMWVQRMIAKHKLTVAWPYVKPLLLLVNSNWVTEPPRPTGPMIKYVGPLLPAAAAPLPADWAEWADGAGPRGAALVSFGGTLAAPPAASRAVLAALASLPDVRFAWKLTAREQAELGGAAAIAAAAPNVRVAEWVPQNDLLGHPSVRAFVTQGGYLSIAEAAFHGVPIVGVPLIAGQGELIRFAADQKRGRMLDKRALLAGNAAPLAESLADVLDTPRYGEEAAKAAVRLRAGAAAAPYVTQAAQWVEYAARLRDHGPFLFTQGQRMTWWEVAMFDVWAAAAALLALPLVLGAVVVSRRRQRRMRRSGGGSDGGGVVAELVLAPVAGVGGGGAKKVQ